MQGQSLDLLLGNLQRSPLFQLSLASKELFHSNFLAWLVSQYPQQMARLFAEYLPTKSGATITVPPKREANHIDLTLKFTDGQVLLVENKVKSLPNQEQLEAYGKSRSEPTGYLLISMVQPGFFDPDSKRFRASENCEWQWLSYCSLADHLEEKLHLDHPYHVELLKDYIGFIRGLNGICDEVCIANPDEAFFRIDLQTREAMQSIRIHDIIDKIRYSSLAQNILSELKSAGFEAKYKKRPDPESGAISVFSEMTNGTGLFDLKYCVLTKPEVTLGIQIQGQTFRLVSELTKNPTKARRVADTLLRPKGKQIWFKLDAVQGGAEMPKAPKVFNQYSKLFWYRYKQLPKSITTSRIVQLVVDYTQLIRDNQRKLTKQVEAGLSGTG